MQKFFKLVIKLMLSLTKIIGILVILFIGIYIYGAISASGDSEKWCMQTIADYENDPVKYLQEHTAVDMGDHVLFHPEQGGNNNTGLFYVYSEGEYACRYSHGGMSKPHAYEYSSKTKTWLKID